MRIRVKRRNARCGEGHPPAASAHADPAFEAVGVSPPSFFDLTDRELEVLCKIVAGKTGREIATALHISEHTVDTHTRRLFAKFQVDNRTALAVEAVRLRLLRSNCNAGE